MSDCDYDYDPPPTKPKRKVLLARISEMEASLTAARAEIRDRPPVICVDAIKIEGCKVAVVNVTVERDLLPIPQGGFVRHLPGPLSMTLRAIGPFPDMKPGTYWLVPVPTRTERNP